MNKKISLQFANVEIQIDSKYVRNGNTVYMNHVAAASAVKQYVKKVYPNVVVSAKSSSFAGGNSVDVYLSDKYGQKVDREIEKNVEDFADLFVYGKFNGMEDMYEYTKGDFNVGEYIIDPSVKYMHVNNRAQYGSVADTSRMLIEMTTTDNYNFGMISLEQAVEKCSRFGVSQSNIAKALALYNELDLVDTYAIEGYVETLGE